MRRDRIKYYVGVLSHLSGQRRPGGATLRGDRTEHADKGLVGAHPCAEFAIG